MDRAVERSDLGEVLPDLEAYREDLGDREVALLHPEVGDLEEVDPSVRASAPEVAHPEVVASPLGELHRNSASRSGRVSSIGIQADARDSTGDRVREVLIPGLDVRRERPLVRRRRRRIRSATGRAVAARRTGLLSLRQVRDRRNVGRMIGYRGPVVVGVCRVNNSVFVVVGHD